MKGFGTLSVHKTLKDDWAGESHSEGIFPTSTFAYDSPEQLIEVFKGNEKGYIYSRWNNPTVRAAEEKIAALESFELNKSNNEIKLHSQLFASGMSAISAMVFACMKPGDMVITQGNLYGGTNELFQGFTSPLGIVPVFCDLKNLNEVEAKIKSEKKIKLIYIETPANPTIDCYDIEELTAIAKRNQLLVAVDNTFASPYLQQPFSYGVDFVMHSTTKYLNGHGNAIGGALVYKDYDRWFKPIFNAKKLLGNNANPFDAWLLLQGMKTLELRMNRHCDNAFAFATHFQHHQKISKLNYCGLPSHPDYQLAKKQMKLFGGMLSFDLKDGIPAGISLLKNLQLATLAVSLGTVDTIIQHPASMSHLSVPKTQRESFGITDGLIRLSVGIENINDIIDDFETALDQI